MVENLGLRIYELRKANGFTQEESATQMGGGVNKTMICKWEKDISMPNLRNAKRLADALGCSLDFLVTGRRSKI